VVNETLRELRVEQHLDKTFVGRIERGFTFLGYWFTKQGVNGVAPSAWKAFRERVARLYEQDAPQEEILRRIGQYVRRWKRWVCPSVIKITFGRDRDHCVFWVDWPSITVVVKGEKHAATHDACNGNSGYDWFFCCHGGAPALVCKAEHHAPK
jgi:hypothetical protein